jgi:hypothetical protein
MAKKHPKLEREQLIEWLEDNDNFELLGWNEDGVSLRKLRRYKEVVETIHVIIEEAATKIRHLERSNFGIGDTATDEAITEKFYSLIH